VTTRVHLASSRVLTPATYALVGANLLIFALMGLADSAAFRGQITEWHANLGVSKPILQGRVINWSGTGVIPAHEWYRLITSGFIHFGFFHVLMNMLLLYQLGMLLERALGSRMFTAVYFTCLLTGSLGVLFVDGAGLTGGASGAVFGLMAAAAVGLHRRGVNVFSTGIGTTLVLNLVLTFTISGISIGGHLGGVVGGAICGWVLLSPTPYPKWVAWATPAALSLIAVVGAIVVVG
jgi:membrane associated rhomboid family serine protease